jgi:hypothetical protein
MLEYVSMSMLRVCLAEEVVIFVKDFELRFDVAFTAR